MGAAVVVVARSTEAVVVERRGSYHRTVTGRPAFLVPFLDRVRARVDLREQAVAFAPRQMNTEDGAVVTVDFSVYFRVTDPRAAVYETTTIAGAVEQLAPAALADLVRGVTSEQVTGYPGRIETHLQRVLAGPAARWGLEVARTTVRRIEPQ